MRSTLILILFFFCCGFYVEVNGEDWREFRGPNQNGITATANLPTEWSESKNVRWFAKTNGLGWSSPVIVRNRIYFTSAVSLDGVESKDSDLLGRQVLKLVCLDALYGKVLFERTIFEQPKDAPRIHNKNSHASPTPVVNGDRIYIHFGHQGTACTDLDGSLVWVNRKNAYPPTHGNGGSPIVADGKLIITCDGGDAPCTLALDLATGTELWRTNRDVVADKTFSFCTPQLIECNGVEQIISPGSNVVQALSPKDGKVLWFVAYDGYSVIPRPLYAQGILLVCTGYNTPKLLAIDPTGSGDVTKTHVKWECATSVPATPSLLCINNQIVMASDKGIATGLDIKTGFELWRKRLGGGYSASPMASGNHVYFQSEAGECVVMKVGDGAEEIARNKLPGRIFASFAVVDQDLVIRSEEGIFRIGNPSVDQ